jgi:hypothetical protein
MSILASSRPLTLADRDPAGLVSGEASVVASISAAI